jgi:hypothetical integral membrane protein (TIGR02206 family)
VTPSRFQPFGPDHLLALAVIAVSSVALSWMARRDRGAGLKRAFRYGLAFYLIAGIAIASLVSAIRFGFSVWDFIPLHLCDFAVLLAAFTLITLRQSAYEVLYFWACAGTALAMLTPDLDLGFPDGHCIAFFGLHGGVVLGALVLTLGFGFKPRRGAPWRVFLFTNAYAAVAAAVDLAFRTNYLYLRAKPSARTILDWFGPWPTYLVSAEALALGLFWLLDQPFRRGGRPLEPAPKPPDPGVSRRASSGRSRT